MDNKKSTYKGMTDARRKANDKYFSEIESFIVRIPKDKREHHNKEEYKAAAAAANMSLNEFALTAMDEKIDRFDQSLSDSDDVTPMRF